MEALRCACIVDAIEYTHLRRYLYTSRLPSSIKLMMDMHDQQVYTPSLNS